MSDVFGAWDQGLTHDFCFLKSFWEQGRSYHTEEYYVKMEFEMYTFLTGW